MGFSLRIIEKINPESKANIVFSQTAIRFKRSEKFVISCFE